MKKFLVTCLMALTAGTAMHAQLLYKISGNGLTKDSYIIGTHHFAKVEFVNDIPGLKAALDAAEQVYGEVVTEEMSNPENMMAMQQKMMMPEGKTLRSLLKPAELIQLNMFLKELMGADMSNPMIAQQLDAVRPMVLVTQLQLLMFMKNHPGDFNPMASFDDYFQKQAKQSGKTVGGLETLDFQADLLYGSYSLERQKEVLMCMANHADFMNRQADAMTTAFYAQDLTAMKTAFDEKIGNSCDSIPEEDAALITNRNADWLTKMPALMAAKSTFFAVGAAHLWGEKGVLQLLKNAGYTVEAAK